ncbi:putative acetyltransferase [Bacillus sp. TS-2]|nr:putative acetyltransferase [Bacillus sp. TS-2]
MIEIIKANEDHVKGIIKVCTEGYRATYKDLCTKQYIEKIIKQFYNESAVLKEVRASNRDWGGYFVAVENGSVIGAGAGGILPDDSGEVFVLYLQPDRRNEGIGSQLLQAITVQQKTFGANKQYVSVQKGNHKGIPFYESKGFVYLNEQNSYGNSEGETYRSLRYCREI